jgi:iron complex outermembrane receptor protein
MLFKRLPHFIAATLFLFFSEAHAQRASENVVKSAQDAFGTTVGNDSIGIYSSSDARGFSPKDAGNMRIEGLYYDQQAVFGYGNQLSKSTTMRVGLSAQSYPFPAPTGIADISLRLPGEQTLVSVSSFFGPYNDSYGGQIDLQTPLVGQKLGGVFSVASGRKEPGFHGDFYYVDVSGILHWTPSDTAEFISFIQRSLGTHGEFPASVFTAGAFVPPKIDRSIYFGPDFAHGRRQTETNIGVIGRSSLFRNWRLQAGLFRSVHDVDNDFLPLFTNTQPDGTADLYVRSRPEPWNASFSGEVRASGIFAEGPRRHTLHIAVKGRVGKRLFGGEDTLPFGTVNIGEPIPFTKPTGFNFGAQKRDKIRHGTAGISYVGQWSGIGEISAGVQKAFYRRTVDQFGPILTTTRNNPWLYNGTLAIEGTDKLTFYASYTRGLEDSGIAPESAANPGEAQAASLTKQADAGLRYRIAPNVTLVAGIFEVKKPYFDRDTSNVFTRVGSLRHRGVEVSLSAQPLEGLKVVMGAVFLEARVAGTPVDLGLIGEVPPGRTPVLIRLNADYGPAVWRGFSLNGRINYQDPYYANRINTVRLPSVTTVDLGARYNFKAYGTSASIRFDAQNVTNVFAWTVADASGRYAILEARRYTVRLAADF